MPEFNESMLDIKDFLLTDPDSWVFDGLSEEEKEEAYWELRNIRRVIQEGKDYVGMSGIEEALGPAIAYEEQMPFNFEAERRLGEFQEKYSLELNGYELIVKRKEEPEV